MYRALSSTPNELCGSDDLIRSATVVLRTLFKVTNDDDTETANKNTLLDINSKNFANITSVNATEEEKDLDLIHLVTSGMTIISILYEVVVAYGIIAIIIMLVACFVGASYLAEKYNIDLTICTDACCTGIVHLLRPLMLIDTFAIIIFAPFGNVYFFVLGCGEAYGIIAIRIAFYLSVITVSAVHNYLRHHGNLQKGDMWQFFVILVTIALKLSTCSSCLATFVEIAYPEAPSFRYTYLIFTVLIGLSALATYYDTCLKLVEVIMKCCIEPCLHLHIWLNHITFWPAMISNLCLLGMNAYILHKHLETDGFDSSGVSLILNVLSLVTAVPLYVLFGIFCGHGPLLKVCYDYCHECYSEDEEIDVS